MYVRINLRRARSEDLESEKQQVRRFKELPGPSRNPAGQRLSSRRRRPHLWLVVTPEEPTRASTTFERAALEQYRARAGSVKLPRAHVERLEDGTEVRLGVWIMNQSSRRAKLTTDKHAALAALGLEWAL